MLINHAMIFKTLNLSEFSFRALMKHRIHEWTQIFYNSRNTNQQDSIIMENNNLPFCKVDL